MRLHPSLRRHPHPDRAGMGLIEVTIAVCILVMSLVAAIRSQVVIQKNLRTTAETMEATNLLASAMDVVLTAPIDDHLTAGAPMADGSNMPLPVETILDQATLLIETPGFAPSDPRPDTLDIRVRLAWVSHSGNQRSSLLTTSKR